MADISKELDIIRKLNYGGDMPNAIADALEKVASSEGSGGGSSDLPDGIYAGTGTGSIIMNATENTASGDYATAEGMYTMATGYASHAEGLMSMATGDYSHADGQGAAALRKSQHVFGEWNQHDGTGDNEHSKGTYVEIVGNGTDLNNLSNARTLDWDGNESLAGDLTLGMGTNDETTITAAQLKALLALLN